MCVKCAEQVVEILDQMEKGGEFDGLSKDAKEVARQVMGLRLRADIECPSPVGEGQTKQQNADGTWTEAKPLPYYYHRPTLRIRLGDVLRRLANKVAGKYWRCANCGWIDHEEKEILCWKCGRGQMIYQGGGPEFD